MSHELICIDMKDTYQFVTHIAQPSPSYESRTHMHRHERHIWVRDSYSTTITQYTTQSTIYSDSLSLSLSFSLSMYTHIYISDSLSLSLYIFVFTYIYINIQCESPTILYITHSTIYSDYLSLSLSLSLCIHTYIYE